MKDYLKGIAVQASAIFLAALGAALFAFLQNIAGDLNLCPEPAFNEVETGAVGALFKGVHSALMLRRGIL